MAHILFTTLGSYGDLYPYIPIGCELQQRGHRVTIATSANYRAKVEGEGLGFAPVRPDISLDNREMLRAFFDQRRGPERVLRAVASVVRDTYEDTLEAARGVDAIVTHVITFGAVLVAEKLRLPWISSVLAPASFMSAYDPPVPAPMPALVKLRVFGPGFMRAVWSVAKSTTRGSMRPVAELRKEIGLPPGENPIFEGSHSPDLVLALFSRVLAEPQPDWPQQTVVTGFPFYDGAQSGLPSELEEFFQAGPRPVVFTLGSSAVGAAGSFYSDSLQAVQRLQTRAILLTGSHPQGLPASLPKNVLAWPYASHAQVFPRASAIVHQGGVGTAAQGLRSGRPSLLVPFSFDQFDNAERVRRIGAGVVVYRSKYNARTAEAALRRLLEDASYLDAASLAAERVRAEDGVRSAADAIEEYLRRRG